MKIHEDGRPDDGHAWITRDGKDFAFALKSLPYKIEKIGENEKYVYWIKSRDGLVDSQDGKKPVPIKTPKRNEYNN